MDLSLFNPWWKSSSVPPELLGMERHVLTLLRKFLGYRQILALYGVRRAGKTTIMYQLINQLLTQDKVSPLRILYFSFDEHTAEIDQILEEYAYQVLASADPYSERTYLFLDEIQKLRDWPNQLKIIYDRYHNLKIVISGSAALVVQKGTKESLAGRFFEFFVEPFSFEEFIEIRGADIDKKRERLYKGELKLLFKDYLQTGGFIEAIEFPEAVLRKYFRESLLERVAFRDIPESFSIAKPQALFRLLQLCAQFPGMYLHYKNLGNDLKMDERTISNYVSYLGYSLLTKKLYNFSPNMLTSEKKLKRLYLTNTGFLWALGYVEPDSPQAIETYFANYLQTNFFYRSPQKQEVDFVLTAKEKLLPVEVKIRDKIARSDLRGMISFMSKFQCSRGLVISKDEERVLKEGGISITMIPYWCYWSIRKQVAEFTEHYLGSD